MEFSRSGSPGEIPPESECCRDYSLRELKRAVLTLSLIAEVLDLMAKGMSQGQEQAVVGLAVKIVGLPHFEVRSSAKEEEGNVVLAMGVALAQLVGPHDCGVVEHGSFSSRLWQAVQLRGEVGDFCREPLIDS